MYDIFFSDISRGKVKLLHPSCVHAYPLYIILGLTDIVCGVSEDFKFQDIEYRRRIELLGSGDFIFNRTGDHRSALSRFLRNHSERPLHIQQRKKRSRAAFSHSQVSNSVVHLPHLTFQPDNLSNFYGM